jgi:hypothetical protein
MDGLNDILDAACPELVVLTARSSLPETMFVHPEVYDVFARTRARELDAGFPLMVLGLSLKPDPALPVGGFRFAF